MTAPTMALDLSNAYLVIKLGIFYSPNAWHVLFDLRIASMPSEIPVQAFSVLSHVLKSDGV